MTDEKKRWFKSAPITQEIPAEHIDKTGGIIYDVVMAKAGPAKGHGFSIDTQFIRDLVAYDIRHFSDTGIKARFGHPALSDNTMGKQLGVFKNFRIRGDEAIADLHLLESADKSPTAPNMREWVLSMAFERPDFIMSSIVFQVGEYFQVNDTGERITLENYRPGVSTPALPEAEVFGTMKDHFFTDLVEQGAVTDRLFSQEFHQDKFAIQVVEFVQDHPDLLAFLQDYPEKILEFTAQLGITLPKPKFSFQEKLGALKEIFLQEETAEIPPREELQAELRLEIEEENAAAFEELQLTNESLQESLTQAQGQVENLQEINTSLQLQIQQLATRIPDEHTEPNGEGPKPTQDTQTQLDPLTQKVRERWLRTHKNN